MSVIQVFGMISAQRIGFYPDEADGGARQHRRVTRLPLGRISWAMPRCKPLWAATGSKGMMAHRPAISPPKLDRVDACDSCKACYAFRSDCERDLMAPINMKTPNVRRIPPNKKSSAQ
jgi:hypothetical protein